MMIKLRARINSFLKMLGYSNDKYLQNYKDELQRLRSIPWFKDRGDETLRLDYNLTKDSVVFDLGGYEGKWTQKIYDKYRCNVFVFEPHELFFRTIVSRFEDVPEIEVFNFGLSKKNQTLPFVVSGASSSAFIDNKGVETTIKLINISTFLQEKKINKIDLMKINIEGGEYELLEGILESNLASKIINIQVQFHDFIVPFAKKKMKKIQNNLSQTHKLTYAYDFVWENWVLKE